MTDTDILIKPKEGSHKKRTRKGRGNASGKGGECGRGHKGQQSRSGYSRKPGFEGGQTPLYRRIPKRRGIGNPKRTFYRAVNLSIIEKIAAEGDVVDTEYLITKNALKRGEKAKILGNGELHKKVTIKASAFSQSAIEKLKASDIRYEKV